MDSKLNEKLEKFLHRREVLKGLRKIAAAGQKSLVIEFEKLLEFDKGLANGLLDDPRGFFEAADKVLEGITKIKGMRLRVKGLDTAIEIRNIRAEHVSKFIQVEGMVTRAGEVKPEAREAVFKCRRCHEEIKEFQTREFLTEPLLCSNPNCRKKGPFDLVVENTVFRDWQSIQLQDPPEKLRGGRMPRRLDGIIRDDFVDKTVPGNRVLMTGVLRARNERRRGERKTTFRKILFVSHIDVQHKGVEEAELTPEDEQKIKEIAKEPFLRKKIIQSVAPAIHGHDKIKEAVALQLFGCNPVEMPDKATRIRGDTHVLLTGDPGTAKSQILKWVSHVAPRGIYTSGVKSTGAGLTAAAVRDELGGGWALEAGTLVIADGGLASIDEFEKMREEDAAAILESMEQQTISVAKAGISATLNTRTAILAATNPEHGRFIQNVPPAQQLVLDAVLLSRFDLVLIMRDEPHPDRDHSMAQHLLQMHSAPKKMPKAPFDTDFLRKIIIYARKNIDPKIDDEKVKKTIENFFVDWRSATAAEGAPLPITPRQLEALIRLTKANARMRLSDRVTVEDANSSIELMKACLKEAGFDTERGVHDIDLLTTGITDAQRKSQREKHLRVLNIIEKLEVEHGGAAPIEKIKAEAAAQGISEKFVEWMIDKEKKRGHLYEPKQNLIARAVK